MGKNIIIANWKCNPTSLKEARELFNSIKKGIKSIKKAEVIICPPFIYLSKFKSNPPGSSLRVQQNSKLKIGGQDCFWEEKGAFTGEISPSMLKDIGCEYVIVGHSERRRYFGETDEMVNKKLKAAIKAGLIPILCIGETREQKEGGETEQVLKRQIEFGLRGVPNSKLSGYTGSRYAGQVSRFYIAYEPVWAIGTGISCDTNEAKKAFLFIKSVISDLYNKKIADDMAILYGGSVSKENSRDYISKSGMNGLLVGGASLKAPDFISIVKSVF